MGKDRESGTGVKEKPRAWHALGREEVLSALGVGEQGLSREEARARLEKYGPNALPSEEKPGALRRLLRQFNNVLIYVLIAASVFTAFLGEWVDTVVILAVVVINAVIGLIQEGRAEQAMESIRRMLSLKATVLRDGEGQEIPADELVPGDIVLLGSGDRVPADLRVLYSLNGNVEEAALTGESEPVDKQAEPVEEDAALGDRKSMAYSGTVVTSGRMRGVVVATGSETEIGRISEMVSRVETISTPLLRKLDSFGQALSVVIVGFSALVFVLGYYLIGFTAEEIFMIVVGLAVSAIPEGLPAIMTIILAMGVQRMARQNAIVRRLPSVETLGSVTVICSDKTGTLTRNEMTVAKVAAAGRTYSVSGVGYRPEGEFSLEGRKVSLAEHPWLVDLARAGLLASDARLRQDGDSWYIEGPPTEGGVVVMAHKAGMNRQDELDARPRLDEIPFESGRRYMASLHADPRGGSIVYVKGAPERLLDMCSQECTGHGTGAMCREDWVRFEEELADSGHRVLAIAEKRLDGVRSLQGVELKGLTMLGLVGIIDPPRQEALSAIRKCLDAGIRVKMITGDHVLTARSIGASMGIGDGVHAVSGRDLEGVEGLALARLVEENDVFARSSPEHKLRIMEALQSRGDIVAMTGDGVNDAPALKRADVGVAMGIKGTEATKEAADMVLADDNFATIEKAVEAGRTIYDNLVKTILFILPTNGAESLMVISAVFVLSDAMPITPIQILWVNMITTVTLALPLAFEPAEENIMERPPRRPDEPLITGYLLWRIALVSVLIAVAAIALFSGRMSEGAGIEEARTLSVNILVAGEMFYLFNTRFLDSSSLSVRGLLSNRQALVAVLVLVFFQLGFTYLDIAHTLFGTAPLPLSDWAWIMGSGLMVFLLVEVEKVLVRPLRRRGQEASRG
ncbi:MAG TPA: cation-transporting P-type ATPase [Deltaproteobacteria bacterium]|nr:cation-transporting P-type ATPase [Deltaproteobacteria bacterium]HOI08097.1 cation-transporting P-type ATPase [Deltaproteobacteria bacterium]